ncbi:AI-2E family transporter [Eilatimonas milleporae]|uniref:Putative PurR-regulated permease PerM n=1 Tax=Eilatimonas milleporae TaxID=911205 RepID=A0A3M0CG70_9PROT|nr:AI-2E family transporter [Eilatimonas milleporae]RMB08598.1 putative PurR-regulated permease PerM [Eilatimonas milleporae]
MNRWYAVGALVVVGAVLYLTRGILLPFVAGMALSYFLDPLTDRLEARGLARGVAAAFVIGFFSLVFVGILVALAPTILSQFERLIAVLPETLAGLRPWLNETIADLSARFGFSIAAEAESVLGTYGGEILARARDAVLGLLQSGLALFNLLSLMLITPVVAFYLLRDWDHMIARLDSWLPVEQAAAIRQIFRDIDSALSGFVRGQIIVCLCMAVLYGTGWTLIGLNFALILGLVAGVLAFVPFLGALTASVLALTMGVAQWGLDPLKLVLVFLIHVIVQNIEGSFLTPRLVGSRVGLHPVWVLFAVFAGGEVMGLVGVLIAVPLAAAIAVFVRFAVGQYQSVNVVTASSSPADEASAQTPVSSSGKAEGGGS